jgi:hypothetical protein
MGCDFCALLKYNGPVPKVAEAIAHLESHAVFEPLDALARCARAHDYSALVDCGYIVPAWRSLPDWSADVPLPARPELPALQAVLDLPAGFGLTFGEDTVRLWNLLRWVTFLTDPGWRQPVLNAVMMFCKFFDATDCIVTHDEHPAALAFLDGATFARALQIAEESGEGEVADLDHLFIDKDHAEDGDYSIPLWDSHGYWRLPLKLA